ncbi:MAG: lysine--tRNA ligase, partial [Candidatus Woesearchaeota archaeon]
MGPTSPKQTPSQPLADEQQEKSSQEFTEQSLAEERLKKLHAYQEAGFTAYPYSFSKSHSTLQIHQQFHAHATHEPTIEHVAIAGRILQLRRMGKVTFMHLQDQEGKIQLYFRENDLGYELYAQLKLLDLGDLLGVSGPLFKTKTGELTLYVKTFTLLAKCLLPLPEKYHGLKDKELRYRQRYLDLIVNPEVKKTFFIRSAIIKYIRSYLEHHGFLEVETPTLQPVYGGGNAKPFVTHHAALNLDLYLRISNELYLKRLLVGGFEKVYEIVKNFRNEGIDATHNPEFTAIEWYEAYGDYTVGMQRVEELIAGLAVVLYGTTKIQYQGKQLDLTPPWKRLTMLEAIKTYAGFDAKDASSAELQEYLTKHHIPFDPNASKGILIQTLFEATCEPHFWDPVFILDHPIETTPLCKPLRSGD